MSHNVLVIDDSERITAIIHHFLEQAGYSVKVANQPEDGLVMAQEGGIDLVILDIMMPRLSGYEVYDLLRKDERTQALPVIMLTAQAVIEATPRTFFFGLYGVLSKPFKKDKLLSTVKKILALTDPTKTARMQKSGGGPVVQG